MAPSACQIAAACPPIRSLGSSVRGSLPPTPQACPLAPAVKQAADLARPPHGSTDFLTKDHRRNGTNQGKWRPTRSGFSGTARPAGHTSAAPDIYDHDERPPPAEADEGLHVWADPDGGDRASGKGDYPLTAWTR